MEQVKTNVPASEVNAGETDTQQPTGLPLTPPVEKEGPKPVTEEPPGDKNSKKDGVKEKDPKEAISKFRQKFKEERLWEQVKVHTSVVRIAEDGDYSWPEKRENTYEIIHELAVKRVLFIQSCSEDSLYLAIQRLSSLMVAGNMIPAPMVRITKTHRNRDTGIESQLEFGFWNGQRALTQPLVVIVSADRPDFLQKVLDQNSQAVLNDFIPDLRKANLFLICVAGDDPSGREVFRNQKNWQRKEYAYWKVPEIKLELTRKFNRQGIELYDSKETQELIKQYGEKVFLRALTSFESNDYEAFKQNFPDLLKNAKSVIEKNFEKLKEIINGDDLVKKMAIFCGAFFDGLFYPDFHRLIGKMLSDETREEYPSSSKNADGSNPPATRAETLLRDVWNKHADKVMKECMLETSQDSGNSRVSFAASKLSQSMSDYIILKHYAFFHRMYGNFSRAGLLTDLSLSEKLQQAVIRFFAIAARTDTVNHNAKWLKNELMNLWDAKEAPLNKADTYEAILNYLYEKKTLHQIIFTRIPLIINGLLINSNEQFREIIQDLFRLLLNEPEAKKMAIIIASYLYKEYRFTETFPIADLMSYFRRTIEEGESEGFFAYDVLKENMNYTDLKKEISKWLSEPDLKEDSGIKKFAYLYQIDYTLETVYRYFKQFKCEGSYELWEQMEGIEFPEEFCHLLKSLVSEASLKCIDAVLEGQVSRFETLAELFEAIETDNFLCATARFLPPFNESFTLVADVLETWFYILSHKRAELTSEMIDDDIFKSYARLVLESCDMKTLGKMHKYWSARIGYYSLVIKELRHQDKEQKNKSEVYRQQVFNRRNSLHLFINVLQQARQTE